MTQQTIRYWDGAQYVTVAGRLLGTEPRREAGREDVVCYRLSDGRLLAGVRQTDREDLTQVVILARGRTAS